MFLDDQEIERKLLIQSKIISTGPSAFHCADCGFTTAYKHCLTNHIEAKHVEGFYTCEQCGREYKSKVALTMHVTRSHRDKVVPVHEQFMSKIRCKGPNDFSCSNCNFSSSTKMGIVKHLQTNLCCQ
jgi:KRAB domain-containing zinc finger protein